MENTTPENDNPLMLQVGDELSTMKVGVIRIDSVTKTRAYGGGLTIHRIGRARELHGRSVIRWFQYGGARLLVFERATDEHRRSHQRIIARRALERRVSSISLQTLSDEQLQQVADLLDSFKNTRARQ